MNTLNGYSKSTLTDNYLLSAGGGHVPLGNASGNVPLSNGIVNVNLKAEYALNADKLSTVSKTAWGLTYWTSGGVPTSISGNISSTGNITPSATHTYNLGSSSLVYEKVYCRYIDTDSGYNLRICALGSEKISINAANGCVGINNTAPTHQLSVGGTSYFNGQVRIDGSTASQPLVVRGIVGLNGTGTVGELYLLYGVNSALYLGNAAGYTISADGGTYSGKAAGITGYTFKTLTDKSTSGWTNNTTDDKIIPTMSFIAYWNGAHNNTNNSNLQYCVYGEIIGSNNYTNYTVKKDGTGATGTWGINISGNAATATCIQMPNTRYEGTNTIPSGTTKINNGLTMARSHNANNAPASYGNIIQVGGGGQNQLFLEWDGTSSTGVTGKIYYNSKRNTDVPWGSWVLLIDERQVNTKVFEKSYATTVNLTRGATRITSNVTGNMTLSLSGAESSMLNLWMVLFTTGSTTGVLTVPSGVKWANGEAPTIDKNTMYEIIFTKMSNGNASITASWVQYS